MIRIMVSRNGKNAASRMLVAFLRDDVRALRLFAEAVPAYGGVRPSLTVTAGVEMSKAEHADDLSAVDEQDSGNDGSVAATDLDSLGRMKCVAEPVPKS